MFDINDPFYQDICSPYKSEKHSSDILLSDRIDYIYNNEDTQCQDNCEFSNYILNSGYINCSCELEKDKKNKTEKVDKFEPKNLYQSFYYVLKYSNYEIFKCYKLVFRKSVFTKNKGSIIVLVLFICYLCCLIYYINKGISPLKSSIENFFEEKGIKNSFKFSLFFPPKKMKNNKSSKKMKAANSRKNIQSKESSKMLTKSQKDNKHPKYQFIFYGNEVKTENNSKNVFKENNVDCLTNKNMLKTSKFKKVENKTEIANEDKENNTKQLDNFELNELEFKEAIKQDKRTIFQMYFYFIKREHRIIFTFFNYKDYNLLSIKLSRFIFLFTTDMAMNVFFFSDSTMHKIFLNYGKYNFVQQIPQIIYSTIVSQFIEIFLCFLSLTDKHLYQIKNIKRKPKNIKKIFNIIKCIKIKLIFYFVFTFIFFGLYWYIISCFCAVYPNTQLAFIKDSLISFLLSLIYPFLLYLIPSALRLCAIRSKDIKCECIYKLSEIIPIF